MLTSSPSHCTPTVLVKFGMLASSRVYI
jgi:hypothetical protein